jgi:hypothetical protein
MSVTLVWVAKADISQDYTVFVHVLSPTGELVAQHDSSPRLPTSLWLPGTPVIDVHTLGLPADLPSGEYQVRVGLYHWPDMERLPVIEPGTLDSENDTVHLGTISLDSP